MPNHRATLGEGPSLYNDKEKEVKVAVIVSSQLDARQELRNLDRELAIARSDPNRIEDQALERIRKLGERRYYGVDAEREQDNGPVGIDHEAVVARAIADALKAPPRDARHDELTDGDL